MLKCKYPKSLHTPSRVFISVTLFISTTGMGRGKWPFSMKAWGSLGEESEKQDRLPNSSSSNSIVVPKRQRPPPCGAVPPLLSWILRATHKAQAHAPSFWGWPSDFCSTASCLELSGAEGLAGLQWYPETAQSKGVGMAWLIVTRRKGRNVRLNQGLRWKTYPLLYQ